MDKKNIVFYALITLLSIVFCVSCKIDESKNPVNSNDTALLGTWEGSAYTSYMGGEPYGDPMVVTFEFTPERFVWKNDGQVVVSSHYSCDRTSQGKYFKWTEGDTSGGDAIFYEINGNTMTINGANGSILMGLPKTMTKK
ncbi:MAG: hypothetical protein MJZ93_00715 [Paludibacteraceae bacterium]|nr:hypothetical protein [Paludibacteraceae bacterium]